ncbi:hypothetical protein DAPPUDRAFT_242095 [Daphnia pulex]|uniref:Uncharacterized protein n=1 Tax=Daphnia pulex TaxID=6669 RepID=E9GFV0_DAPPU|nr:hypothetical protein DAPPUDRAFT_242095 [Daphnia pulex]|eukprot:EFX81746.1 hypothetical protein DAPPUDRAFT_242095 [Daphnia pulex]
MSLGNRLTIDAPGHRIHPHSVLFAGYSLSAFWSFENSKRLDGLSSTAEPTAYTVASPAAPAAPAAPADGVYKAQNYRCVFIARSELDSRAERGDAAGICACAVFIAELLFRNCCIHEQDLLQATRH